MNPPDLRGRCTRQGLSTRTGVAHDAKIEVEVVRGQLKGGPVLFQMPLVLESCTKHGESNEITRTPVSLSLGAILLSSTISSRNLPGPVRLQVDGEKQTIMIHEKPPRAIQDTIDGPMV